MKKRMLSALLAVCMMLTMVPVAFAAGLGAPSCASWGDLAAQYTGVYSINFTYPPNNEVEASGVYFKSANNAYILTGADDNEQGAGTVWPEELIPRIVDSYSYSDWEGEYNISLFVTANTDWFWGDALDTSDATKVTTTDKKLYLNSRTLPAHSNNAVMNCTWEHGEFGSYTERLTINFDGTFEPGWYYGQLSYPEDITSGGQSAWFYADESGILKSYNGSLFDTHYGGVVNDIPAGAPRLELYKVDTILSTDQSTMSISISPEIALIGTANPNAPTPTPPTVTESSVELYETSGGATISDDADISAADKEALEAVLRNAEVTGLATALSQSGINRLIEQSEIEINNNQEIKIEVWATLLVTAANLSQGTITFEAWPFAKINGKDYLLYNDELNGLEISVSLPIPDGFVPKEILHISDGQRIEQYLLKDGAFTSSGDVAKLSITHFSELRMNETETVAAKIRGSETGYFSLQAAVDAASTSGDTIDLYKNCDDTVIRIASKSLTIDCNTYTINNDVDWQLTGCAKTESMDDEGHRIITITRTSGSSSSSSGGGSSSSGNLVSVSQNNHGTISVSPNRAQTGDTVTVTIDPDEGYVLDELIVTDRNGNRVEVERISDNEYTFTKPSGLVKVEATFTEDEQPDASRIPFTDVATTAWYYDAVRYMYESGMMNGTSANTFSPNETTTRAMIVTMLHRLEGEPNASGGSFTDVASSMYYADAIAWAQANGVVNGTSATTFSPDQAITREQMAAILYRYAQFKGYDVTAGNSLNAYTDASQISPYAATAMQWANAEGLITGNTATTINPAGNATRAEVATILMRFAENIA